MEFFEILTSIIGTILGLVLFLLVIYDVINSIKSTKKSERLAQRNSSNLERLANSHCGLLCNEDLIIISDLMKGRNLEDMRKEYGEVFVLNYDSYSDMAEKLSVLLFEHK